MAGSVHTFETFIKSSYGIQVAARCSSDVEDICQKNYLSFCELLRPFSQLTSESRVQDPQGHLYPVRNLRLRFTEPVTDVLSSCKVDQLLSDTVHWSEQNALDGSSKVPLINVQNIVTPATTPWFDHYCETFIDNINVMEHENVRHYVAVILVVSSRQHHPVEAIQSLYRAQKESEQRTSCPYWIPSPHIFYYHVLLHDVLDGNSKHARECFDVLKSTYGGGNCYLLHVNSLDPTSQLDSSVPEPWTAFLRIPSSPSNTEHVDFGFARFKRKGNTNPSQSPQIPSKANSTPPLTSNSTSVQPPSKPDKMRGEPTLDIEEQEKGVGPEGEENEQSSSSVSIVSSQVELGEDPLSGSDSGNMEEEETTVVRVGICMSVEDQNTLRTFVKDFSNRLLSHLEAVLRKLNDALQSRRTVSRRMSSFSRGFLWKMMGGGSGSGGGGGGSSGGGGGGGGTPAGNGETHSLSADSIERQMRLVGDLAFLLHNYELAYNMHHTLKRDLQGRDLWIHYAGAHEMAALSAQMMGSSRKEIQSYLEEATSIYTKQLKLPNLGLRASIFLCEILKSRQKYRELSSFLVKLTPDESDLRSALLFEQIAHAYLKFNPIGMIRKYALNMILSAHYYIKAGQKAHAVRVYRLVLQVYRDNGWIIAEDFIQSVSAKLFFVLKRPQQALHSLESILSHENHQMVQNQMSCLRDYIHIRRVLLGQSNYDLSTHGLVNPPWSSQTSEEALRNVPCLPIPFFGAQNTTVIFDNGIPEPEKWINKNKEILKSLTSRSLPKPSIQSPNVVSGQTKNSNGQLIVGVVPYVPCHLKLGENGWRRLEEFCFSDEAEDKGIKPAVLYMGGDADNSRSPLCPINEPVRIDVSLTNPLAVPLLLRCVSFIWKFEPLENQDIDEPGVICEVVERYILPPKVEDKVSLWVVPIKPGSVEIKGLVYNLCTMEDDVPVQDDLDGADTGALSSEGIQGKLEMYCQGLRLNNTKTERLGVVYGNDNRLCWKIIDPMPRAIMVFSGLSDDLVAGEIVPLSIKLINCSSVPLTNPKLSTSLDRYILLDGKKTSQDCVRKCYTLIDPSSYQACHSVPSPSSSFSHCLTLSLKSGTLLPGESEEYCLLFQIPQSSTSELPWNIVLYYEPPPTVPNCMSHRVVRHCEALPVQQCVHVKASAVPSVSSDQNIKQESNKLLISVDVVNSSGLLGSAVQLKVLQISSISYSWQISNIGEANEYSCKTVLPGGETVFHISASRRKNFSSTTLLFSDVPFVETKMISSSQFPVSDFYFANAAPLTKKANNISSKSTENNMLESEITLIIFWEAEYTGSKSLRTIHGHHSITLPLPQDIPILKMKDSLTLPPTVAALSSYDLVKHSLCYSPCIKHDFTKENICTVAVCIMLENCSSQDLMVSLELLLSAEVSIGTRSLEPSFHWSGPVKRFFPMSSLSKLSEHVYVNFSAPGIYDLNALRIKACCSNTIQDFESTKPNTNNWYNQRWHTANYVIVKSKE